MLLRPFCCVCLLLLPVPLTGQLAPWVQPGARVRLNSRGNRAPVIGTLVRFDANSVVLVRDGGDTLTLPSAGITGADVRRERATHMGDGALVGLFVGGSLGVAAGASSDTRKKTLVAVVFGAVFGAFGAGVGAVIGSGRPKDIWEPVTISARAGGLGIGLSIQW